MLLENKNAVIYGAGGSIGAAVAREFAQEGAKLFLTGRTLESLEAVAKDITSAGGSAEVAELDALDELAVDEHARQVAEKAGSIDISFNLITRGDVQGIPLVEMTTEDGCGCGGVSGLRSGRSHHRHVRQRYQRDVPQLAAAKMDDKEVSVRKAVAVELVSVDGVMESPEKWAFSYSNDEMEEANASGMAASDALLLGRVTYEGMAAFWPNQPGGTPMVDYINSVPKYVLSTTLEEPLEWNNSTLIKGNEFAEEAAELKRRPGKDITILGSGALVRSLLMNGLLDELRLMVCPVILGGGKRLFEDGGDGKALKLVDSRTFSTGVLYLSYQPAGEQGS
jgi:dihydrofolate reductase